MPTQPQDPYETFNRTMFAFNHVVDKAILRPVTHVYNTITPPPAQKGVLNFFHNIGELTSIPNDLLQGKMEFMMNDLWRFIINTTVGVGGLFDVAKHMGLPRHVNSFGLTLAYWEGGKQKSPYLVMPLLGPGTFRNTFGRVVDMPTTPYFYIKDRYWYWAVGLKALDVISNRNTIMDANKLIDTAYDPYVFLRDAYLRRDQDRINRSLHEKYGSKEIVDSNYMSTSDFTAEEAAMKKAGSQGMSAQKAESEGYVFDDGPAPNTTKTKPKQ